MTANCRNGSSVCLLKKRGRLTAASGEWRVRQGVGEDEEALAMEGWEALVAAKAKYLLI